MQTAVVPHAGRRAVRCLVVGLLATCGLVTAAHSQTLRWASQGDLQTLDPYSQNELLTNAINGQVYETLVSRDRELQLVPGLATAWQQLSPTVWRMQLRPGVKFHDGSPLTVDDVVFSVQRARDPASGIRAYATAMGEPRKVDEATVEFTLAQVNPIFLQHATLVQIMNKAWCEKNGAQRPQDFKGKEEKFTALNANGTGPFVVVSRQPDVRTVYRRNPNWWGSFDGNVQEVVYTPIKSDATRTAALVSGEIDLLLDPVPQDLARLRGTAGVKVIDGVENRALFIGMDQAREELLYSSVKGRNPFRDVRVRRALYHAVDAETLRTRLMRGQAVVTGSVLPSPLGHYNDPAFERRLPFDLARARALLAEAGYPTGFDVTLDCPNNRYVNDEEICIALSAMWAQIGVKVRVNAQPRALYFPKAEKLDVSMYMLGWGGAITDAETTLKPVLRARGEGGVGYYNWGNVKNAKLDALAAASSQEADPARREQLIKAALREHDEQAHHIPLHRQVIPWAMRANVTAAHRADNWLEWRWVQIAPR
ncbi:ABC transporter substrate-binding protein [Pseudorhodoferax sp. Leaf267]|uniref:ABC transporter substrate-binding protein n=1 Tax=Pseudorhodoferax sp. Leaf267 TaxID=1736316 RepID=UPI0006F82931|nr:ABC transporter substrate-binding protein [Pseudorhodoferax sp. Leaf267]KQP13812.1 ABC transporter substrate-binding protein [Pseudorhodoferax sp. Leaf267]